ncbi:MAG: ATPase, T2SS/T4P/T4SS family, partial [Thermoplasmata archaeon]
MGNPDETKGGAGLNKASAQGNQPPFSGQVISSGSSDRGENKKRTMIKSIDKIQSSGQAGGGNPQGPPSQSISRREAMRRKSGRPTTVDELQSPPNVKIYSQEDKSIYMYYVSGPIPQNPYGALGPLIEDDLLEEIMYNEPSKCVKVFHRKYGMCDTNIIISEKEIVPVIESIASYVGKTIDSDNPLLDARLPDGSRVNATLPPVSPNGPTLTIRKFLKFPLTVITMIKNGTLDLDIAALIWMWVEGLRMKPCNILIAGGTSSGKTTTLNSIGMFIPEFQRLVTIEDTAELQFQHDHWIRLEAAPPTTTRKEITLDDLLKNSLRMRPDRIIVGEVRGAE